MSLIKDIGVGIFQIENRYVVTFQKSLNNIPGYLGLLINLNDLAILEISDLATNRFWMPVFGEDNGDE